ncbi:Cell surface glycoprotein [Wickerhamomyces ciferrii]|uniref:Cell surface glycoprotein n=1 Tax=Wickerhamomyces ciferrii (strain ATCC 14091 / BCRC 22168 / CBS 111 / JCM 3599 / NBRC 0793 / NRRL Y-1031 F-60-10) TaxID=1206466 RepID=K0KUR5_WICCF|nr:Cell surface glycoprotein [Wickerhamomyces ciferrii]CCH46946.1 Cell surface glycoprotein [Wickerhamomyces ciferrii]
MSNFWDNNKESILNGAKTAAVTTGKYGYKGAKFVGKTGYQAAKNQRAANVRGQQGKSGEQESPSFGEARPLNSLPSVDHLPPPPLKPGQGQYTSKSKSPPQAQLSQPAPQYTQVPAQQGAPQPQLPQRNLPQPPQQQTHIQQPAQQPIQQPAQVPVQQQYVPATQQQYVQQPVIPPRDQTQSTTAQQPTTQSQVPFAQSLQQNIQNSIQQSVQKGVQDGLKQQFQQFVNPNSQGSQPPAQAPAAVQAPIQSASSTTTTTQPVLDFKNPYYQGAVSQPQEYKVEPLTPDSTSASAHAPAQNTSAPPPPSLGPRTYNRAAILPPQGDSQITVSEQAPTQVSQQIEQPQPQAQQPFQLPQSQPQPQQFQLPGLQPQNHQQSQSQPPLTVNTEAANDISSKLPIQQAAGLALNEQTVQSPDLSKLPVPPKHKDITPTGSPALKTSTKLNQTSTGGSSALKTSDTGASKDDKESEEPKKGISGNYDYKIDVKFAPPPKPRGSVPSKDHHKPISRTSTAAPPTPVRSSSVTPKPPSRQSTAPPPLRASTNTSTSSLSHAPPPPPPRSSAGSSANVSDVEDNSGAPPPPYVATAETDSHSSQHPSTTNLPQRTFAPPPKPFRRPDESSNTSSKPKPAPPTRVSAIKPPAPPTRTGSDVSALSLPPPANPSLIEESKNKKAPPPVVKPKPSNIDVTGTKKAPPPVKPKPSSFAGEKKTPPPIVGKKPDIPIPGKKLSPPVPGKKPSISANSRTAVGSAAGNFSAVVSELPRKNNDKTIPVKTNNGITKEDLGGKQEDENEDFEDNPFKRYLKNAVPKEDDRFKK